MPKKKNPQLAKVQAEMEAKQFFDSADYEVKRAGEQNPQARQKIATDALRAPHVASAAQPQFVGTGKPS